MPEPSTSAAAYGGAGWSPRTAQMRDEIGSIWAGCGIDSEWRPLRSVLMHRPGRELDVADADAAQMLERPDAERAAAQHDALADVYRAAGVVVHFVAPDVALPNQMYCADLFVMTPAGAILARPASTVRAGEERWVARKLAALGVPILRSIGGRGTFEGADAMWLDDSTVMIGRGPRTNDEGAQQVAAALAEQGIAPVVVDLPRVAMHLMGVLRIVDRDLALVRRGLLDDAALAALRDCGCDVHHFPDEAEMDAGAANNFVVLERRRIVMPAGNPLTQRFYESLGITCIVTPVDELAKGAGAIGCLTGVLSRDVPAPRAAGDLPMSS
jgi:arginine deiminase